MTHKQADKANLHHFDVLTVKELYNLASEYEAAQVVYEEQLCWNLHKEPSNDELKL